MLSDEDRELIRVAKERYSTKPQRKLPPAVEEAKPATPKVMRERKFVYQCLLCGAPAANRYCSAHSWAGGEG